MQAPRNSRVLLATTVHTALALCSLAANAGAESSSTSQATRLVPPALVPPTPPAAAPVEPQKAPAPAAASGPARAAPARPTRPPAAQEPPASKTELEALRSEVSALRQELERVVGGAEDTALSAERERLQGEIEQETAKLAAIQAAVAGGLERTAVADSIEGAERRIAQLQASIAKLAAAGPRPARSLSEVSKALARIDATLASSRAEPHPASAADAAAVPPHSEERPNAAPEKEARVDLLPLEFTAFGDFYYSLARPGADDFHIGVVELDASLRLTPFVLVSTAIAYSGESDAFGLGAFVIDCGLFGHEEGYPLPSQSVQKSGISFGRFDVPFGIAYLEYPSVSNRFVTLPQAVQATHAGWNDLGAQGYVLANHWSAVAYVVNGPADAAGADEAAPPRTAAGGRVSAKVDGLVEVGGSAAATFAASGAAVRFAGGDLAGSLGPVDLRGEYLLKYVNAPGVPRYTHGGYGRAVVDLKPAFLLGRYDTAFTGSALLERRVAAGVGLEVFPEGEVRAVYEQSLDSDLRTVTLQLVGGSSFQPTGLRR